MNQKLVDKKTFKQFEYYNDSMFLSVLSENAYAKYFKKYFAIAEKKTGEDFLFCKTMPIYKLVKTN